MSRFSPVTAATEGFRVMRREPVAVAVWTLLWAGTLMAIAALKPKTAGLDVLARSRTHWTLQEILVDFGPLGVAFIIALATTATVTTTAVFRVVFRPEERSGFFLRFGMDELRLTIMAVVTFVLLLLFGGVPFSALFFLFTPFFAAVPTMAKDIAFVGSIVSVVLEIWVGVRLSLIAAETFAERRFHLSAYWPLARGRFWRLLASYIVVFVCWLPISILIGSIGGVVALWALSTVRVDVALTAMERSTLLGFAALEAVLAGAAAMMLTLLVGACQAYCFRALADDSPTVYGTSWAPDPKAHHDD